MSKKIVFLADCLITQSAGIHHYAKQFIHRCITEYPGHKYYCILPEQYGVLDVEEIIVPIRKIPFHYRYRSLRSIPKKVNALNPDLVIEMAHFGPFNIRAGTKTCTVVHDLTPITHPEWHDKISHLWHKRFFERTLKKSDYIIANSESTKKELSDLLDIRKEKVQVSYPHFKLSHHKSTQQNKYENYILTVGTIEPRKNYINLLKAFDILAKTDSTVRLVIAGKKGWKCEDVYQYIENSPNRKRIHLTGYINNEEKHTLYSNTKAFVFPSHKEGFGIPLLEAMGYGLPIICSDIAITQEVCGQAATYFDQNNPLDISSKIAEVLKSETRTNTMKEQSSNRYKQLNQTPLNMDRIFGSL